LNYDKIKKLIYTEKSNKLVANDKYTFEIDYNCTKKEIASLIKKIFNVDVKKVNIINSFGKTKRFKGIVGSKSDIKKAIITLQTGQKINFD
jgi:large subunit ribosomal protein L23